MTTVEEFEQKRWEGTAKYKVNGVSPDCAWPFIADFFNWKIIFPIIESSIEVEGISGKVGSTRKVTLIPEASLGWEGNDISRWGVERLTDIDHTRKWLRYELLDNTFGLENYEATMEILPLQGDIEGCEIIWSFSCDPPKDGRSIETMISAYEAGLGLGAESLKGLCGVSK